MVLLACREASTKGALVLPSLYGGGERSHQIMLFLSVADEFGGAGKYSLVPAMTGYTVSLMDSMGDALPAPGADAAPVFGGATGPEAPSGLKIIVDGIRVMVDAGKCDGTMIEGPWSLAILKNLVPTASSGASKDEVHFDGLDAMTDPTMNASPGWIKFKRAGLECKMDFGDGDAATGSSIEDADGVPTTDERTYKAGTLVRDEAAVRTFLRHHGTSPVEVHYPECDLRSFLVPEVSSGSGELGGIALTKDRLSLHKVRLTDRDRTGGVHFGLPLFLTIQ